MQNFKFEPGDKVKDAVTGFVGVVMGCYQYMTGCNRYGVQSDKLQKDNGAPGEWHSFDENVLSMVKKGKVKLDTGYESKKTMRRKPGGPPTYEPRKHGLR